MTECPMIKSVQFRNFKALRDATLPLDRFTLIVGPNGSGTSTALKALGGVFNPSKIDFQQTLTSGVQDSNPIIEGVLNWGSPDEGARTSTKWTGSDIDGPVYKRVLHATRGPSVFRRVHVYAFEAQAIAAPARLLPKIELGLDGTNLAGVLDSLRDREPVRFEALNEALGRWLPEFDRILFETPDEGRRSLLLRTRQGQHKIAAIELSQGTLLALAILTLAYIPDPPHVVCLEEPDRGIHPRLFRDVRDAMYRLSHPKDFGETRPPVQVIATTHSPYLLDLYDDHPEEVVIAQKVDQNVRFERLSERPDIDEILQGAQLGDVWYSGILGGVPANS